MQALLAERWRAGGGMPMLGAYTDVLVNRQANEVVADINAARGITAGSAEGAEEGDGQAPVRAAFSAVRGPLVFATLAMLLGTVPFLFLGTVAVLAVKLLVWDVILH